MHAARRRQLYSTDAASAKIRRRLAVARAKGARERSLHDLHMERPRLGFHTANVRAPCSTMLDAAC
jgi:hypothetical protein